MARPLRIEFPGALYHVTARGDQRGAIYRDDTDRYIWLEVLGLVCARFHFVVHSYCQMTNHYHFLVETVEGNLADGMRQLNGIFSQRFNQRHDLRGHVFQGRYHAVLVQKEAHLLELARYIVLNPMRAGMVSSLDAWHWSSHHNMLNSVGAPAWLNTDWLLGQFGVASVDASAAYRQFISEGAGLSDPLKATRHQLLLGDDAFASKCRLPRTNAQLVAVPKVQRRSSAMTLSEYEAAFRTRDEAMARAYWSTAFTMAEIGAHFGVTYKTVGRAVRRYGAMPNLT